MTKAGRFAPSPTGPLHFGSLVAALGSWLFARRDGARWLVRMEDLDAARVVPGAAEEILRILERYGLRWDGEVLFQSRREDLYAVSLEQLRAAGRAFPCACSRSEVARAASAPGPGDGGEGPIYPGTCRNGTAGRSPRAWRFRVEPGVVRFTDQVFGEVAEDVARRVGDFVLRRADGPFAYQLAAVIDDGEQGVTTIVRGADLLDSSARQIQLRQALGLGEPGHAHLPVVVGPDGRKVGKRDGALPLERLDEQAVRTTLRSALRALGQVAADGNPGEILEQARRDFDAERIPRGPLPLSALPG
jgi:glutamyl-Q tRNA(Asp) synthetase